MLYKNRQSINRPSQRKHPRADYSGSVHFRSYSATAPDDLNYNEDFEADGTSKNISPGGILFQTKRKPPTLSSILWMDLDRKTIKAITMCLETGQRPLIFENGLLGKIAHIQEGSNGQVQVGVSFITKFDATLP